jgi:hypothetical protein
MLHILLWTLFEEIILTEKQAVSLYHIFFVFDCSVAEYYSDPGSLCPGESRKERE